MLAGAGAEKIFTELFQWVASALTDNVNFTLAKETYGARNVEFLDSEAPTLF